MKVTFTYKVFFLVVLLSSLFSETIGQNLQSARSFFDQALKIEKTDPEGAFGMFLRTTEEVRRHDASLGFQPLHHLVLLGDLLEGDFRKEAFIQLRSTIKMNGARLSPDSIASDLFYFAGDWFRIALQPDSSLMCFERALEIRKKLFGTRSEEVAACFFGIGDDYKYSLYDFDAAERNYENALEIRESLNPRNEFQLARSYFNLATTNRSQGDFEKAISYGLHTVEIVRKIKDGPFLEATYSILGNIYRDVGQYDSARRLYELAILLNKRNNKNQQNEVLATFYQGLGALLQKEGRYDEAIRSYDQGLKIFFNINVKDKIIFVHCLQQLGQIYAIKKERDRALHLYRQALRILSDLNLLKGGSAAGLFMSVGDLFRSENRLDSALFYYQKSLISGVQDFNSLRFHDNPSLSKIGLRVFVYMTLSAKAETLMQFFRQTKLVTYASDALSCYSLAEQLLVASRNSLDREEAKWAYLDENFTLYEQSIEAIFELSHDLNHDSIAQMAFSFFEGGKSRSLAEALKVAQSSNREIFTDSLFQKQSNYRISLFNLQEQLRKVTNGERLLRIRNTIIDLDRKLKVNDDEIRKRYPGYLDIDHARHIPLLDQVQQFVRKDNMVLVEYFWGQKFVYAMGITGSQVMFKRISATDSLASRIRTLITFFQNEGSSLDFDSFQTFARTSFELHQLLLNPLSPLLEDKDRIIIVPDGLISQVPFEVLVSQPSKHTSVNYRDLSYFVRDHITDYAFSSSFLLAQTAEIVADPKMLAFGLSGTKSATTSSGNDGAILGGAVTELASLARQFPSGRFYLGDRATKHEFLNMAPGFDLIHLAIHGKGDTERNYAASLSFVNANDSANDGELHWYELYGVRLKAALVVLSSCESGIGKTYKGEGMLSMANAFANSGCRNLLLGLWKVNDQVSVQLMDKFYAGVLEGRRIDDALAIAKRDYLAKADELSAHPKMWGALVAFGNLQIVEKEKSQWIYFSIALFISLLCIGCWIKMRA